jgi:UDP-3-O-[3-hydroxymyristoyl] glucosamine N-acyltransferase
MSERRTFTLEELRERVGGTILPPATGGSPHRISGVAGIEDAGPGDVTFYESPRFLPRLRASRAAAVLVSDAVPGVVIPQIKVDGRPYLKFIDLVQVFHPPRPRVRGVHPSALVDPDATLGDGVMVGPLAVIKAGARVGRDCIIGSQAYVGPGARLGDGCHLFPRAVVRGGCELGHRVIVHCGAVIGDDGFGYVRDGDRHVKIPHIGRVVIEDDVEIGANATIDRATFGATVIGAGTKIDNLVQIAHNVRVGKRCILAAQVGVAGSSQIGDDTILAGQVGVAGGSRIGRGVIAASQAGISATVGDGEVLGGTPARDHRLWRRAAMAFYRLPEILRRLRALERKLGIDS